MADSPLNQPVVQDSESVEPDGTKSDILKTPVEQSSIDRFRHSVLLFSVFVVGTCGLLYELVAGAAASYLVGDTVTQYSLVIGVFLAAMGLGAFLTQWILKDLIDYFLIIQLILAVVGGFSSMILFWAFASLPDITVCVLGLTGFCGVLVGMEIPLVLRLLKESRSLRISVAQVLTLDYLGALVASICFPFVMLPLLGLIRAAIVTGFMNGLVALLGTCVFWNEIRQKPTIVFLQFVCWTMLGLGWLFSGLVTTAIEDRLYPDEIILAESSRYQRIVITRRPQNDDIRLYLEGHLQFSTSDEFRYHEALVLPGLKIAARPDKVLILGGGDGLAIRKILDYCPSISRIDLVDIDQRVVELFRTNKLLCEVNGESLKDQRVQFFAADAFSFLRSSSDKYDFIIADLPDPSNIRVNKLYSRTFFQMALGHLNEGGVFVTQATSPYFARQAFWCIDTTVQSAIEKSKIATQKTLPYHVSVPSFGGDWGFVMVTPEVVDVKQLEFDDQNRFLTTPMFRAAVDFPPDSAKIETKTNTLLDPVLVRYHTQDWSQWYD